MHSTSILYAPWHLLTATICLLFNECRLVECDRSPGEPNVNVVLQCEVNLHGKSDLRRLLNFRRKLLDLPQKVAIIQVQLHHVSYKFHHISTATQTWSVELIEYCIISMDHPLTPNRTPKPVAKFSHAAPAGIGCCRQNRRKFLWGPCSGLSWAVIGSDPRLNGDGKP